MALSLSVAVKAEILIKRETLMNRSCHKVLLHRGGHRVIRVAQLIHRGNDRRAVRAAESVLVAAVQAVQLMHRIAGSTIASQSPDICASTS